MLRLKLRTSCNESLTSFVSFVLLEVLDEACSQIFSLFFPLSYISISITWVEDVRIYTFQLCRNYKVEVWNRLGWSLVDRVIEDSIDNTTGITDRDTLASSVPTGVNQISLSTALLHLLNQFFSILGWMKFQESLAEASRESWSRLCNTAFCTCQLSSEA